MNGAVVRSCRRTRLVSPSLNIGRLTGIMPEIHMVITYLGEHIKSWFSVAVDQVC